MKNTLKNTARGLGLAGLLLGATIPAFTPNLTYGQEVRNTTEKTVTLSRGELDRKNIAELLIGSEYDIFGKNLPRPKKEYIEQFNQAVKSIRNEVSNNDSLNYRLFSYSLLLGRNLETMPSWNDQTQDFDDIKLLTDALDRKVWDCDTKTAFLLGFGEKTNQPFYPVIITDVDGNKGYHHLVLGYEGMNGYFDPLQNKTFGKGDSSRVNNPKSRLIRLTRDDFINTRFVEMRREAVERYGERTGIEKWLKVKEDYREITDKLGETVGKIKGEN